MLAFPASELAWWSLCFSIDDDMRDPKLRKELLSKPHLVELSPEEQEERFRMEFS